MAIFSLLVFPLASLWLISGERNRRNETRLWVNFRDYFFSGMVYFVPSMVVVRMLTSFLERTYSYANIYFYHLFVDFALLQLLVILCCVIRFRDVMFAGTEEKIIHFFLFFSGFFAALALYSAIVFHREGDIYYYFLLPVTRVLIAGLTALVLVLKDFETGWMKYLYLLSLFLLAAAGALVPFFFYIRISIVSYMILSLFMVAGYYLLRVNSIDL